MSSCAPSSSLDSAALRVASAQREWDYAVGQRCASEGDGLPTSSRSASSQAGSHSLAASDSDATREDAGFDTAKSFLPISMSRAFDDDDEELDMVTVEEAIVDERQETEEAIMETAEDSVEEAMADAPESEAVRETKAEDSDYCASSLSSIGAPRPTVSLRTAARRAVRKPSAPLSAPSPLISAPPALLPALSYASPLAVLAVPSPSPLSAKGTLAPLVLPAAVTPLLQRILAPRMAASATLSSPPSFELVVAVPSPTEGAGAAGRPRKYAAKSALAQFAPTPSPRLALTERVWDSLFRRFCPKCFLTEFRRFLSHFRDSKVSLSFCGDRWSP